MNKISTKDCRYKDKLYLFLAIKGSCDNECIFCSRGRGGIIERESDYKKIIESINKHNPSRFSEVMIGGGEPLNFRNIKKLLANLKKNGYKKICIQTNGRKLSNVNLLKELIGFGVSGFWIPLYGSKSLIHDNITGIEGSFQETIKGIRNLIKLNVDYSLHTVILKQNLKNLGRLWESCKKKFNKDLKFLLLHPDSETSKEYYSCAPKLSMIPKDLLEKTNLNLPCITKKSNNHIYESNKQPFRIGAPPRNYKRKMIKLKRCKECAHFEDCDGYYLSYFRLHGTNEFKPIPKIRKNKALNADCIFEKKRWISVTGLCNNNCVFCLDGNRPDKFHRNSREIKEEIKKAREEGNTKLVLSGGDPTIHPDIINFVRCGKKLGYSKIQVITNGRMFASKEFTDEIIDAGLDEVTFSIHGHNSKIHDSLTQVKGSFRETLRGTKNVFSSQKKMIVNTDTCITKANYRDLPKTIRFIVEKVGITEVNLMSMVPQGNAWKYKDDIMCDHKDAAEHVHEVIDYCIEKDVVLWLSRFPAEYLEGYENFIYDSYKIVDDIRGCSEGVFRNKTKPECLGEKCRYCGINLICKDIFEINNLAANKKIEEGTKYDVSEITEENYYKLPDSENILIKYPSPVRRLENCRKRFISLTKLKPFLVKLKKSRFKDIPPCIVNKDRIIKDKVRLKDEYFTNGRLDYVKITEDLTLRIKIKRLSCKGCRYNNDCEGFYKKYFRIYGFKEIKRVK